ncbi:hypothetical protein NT01EI_3418 [Edwardsiella ictaluri 93-146]|uniref:Uncharacterized protein n=1 Tax=Edwardsiella ictaluri (strain 93-146) TaxID=634503 RepID=C5BBU9_EDWI9|nr:hypothetical protein NT01EI_3418 [Edwardsiella ictaluri 93-146]
MIKTKNKGMSQIGLSGENRKRTTANRSVNKAGPYIDINDLNIRLKNLLIRFIMIIEPSW